MKRQRQNKLSLLYYCIATIAWLQAIRLILSGFIEPERGRWGQGMAFSVIYEVIGANLFRAVAIALLIPIVPAVAAEIDQSRSVTRVSVHVRDADRREVLDDLFRQGTLSPPVFPATQPGDSVANSPTFTADIDNQPFWEAVESIGQSMGIEPVEVIDFNDVNLEHSRRIKFEPVSLPHGESPRAPFLFQAFMVSDVKHDRIPDEIVPPMCDNGIGRKRPMPFMGSAYPPVSFVMRTLIDPAITVVAWKSPFLTHVTNAASSKAIPLDRDQNADNTWLSWQRDARQLVTANTPYRLKAVPSKGKLLLGGYGRFLIVQRTSKIEILNLMRLCGPFRRVEQEQIVNLDPPRREFNGMWSMRVRFTRGNLDAATWEAMRSMHADVDVTDAKGRALAGVHGHYDRGDDTSGVMEVRADQLVQNNAARFGPPDRLVWNEPIAARWINVPFEMTLDLR